MPRYRHFATAILGLAVVLSADRVPVHAATTADLFDPNTIQEIRLRVNSRDWANLLAHYQDNTHYTAMLQWRDLRVWNVSIRVRGLGSRNPIKPSLQVDFSRYATRQRFLGLSSLGLINNWQDPTMIRARTAMAFFNRMGQPAPRETSAKVYINDVYYGLYTLGENVDEAFLARNYADVVSRTNPGGFLYEYHQVPGGGYYLGYLGDTLPPYIAKFEARTRTTEADTTLYSPIRDWVTQVNSPYDAVWRSRVEQYIDLKQLVTYVAIENFLAEWDGFTGEWGTNNFYLYRTANSVQMRIVPWDVDLTFHSLGASIFVRSDQNVLFSRAIAFSDLRTLYLDVMEACAKSAAQDNWLTNQLTVTAALLSDAVHNDPKQWSTSVADQDTAYVLQFGPQRPGLVLAEVAQARLSAAGR